MEKNQPHISWSLNVACRDMREMINNNLEVLLEDTRTSMDSPALQDLVPPTAPTATLIWGLAMLYSSRTPDAATPPRMPYWICQKLIRKVTVKGSRSSSVGGEPQVQQDAKTANQSPKKGFHSTKT